MTEIEVVGFGYGIEALHNDMDLVSIVSDYGNHLKTFRGETAWSDAERYAYDIAVERQYA